MENLAQCIAETSSLSSLQQTLLRFLEHNRQGCVWTVFLSFIVHLLCLPLCLTQSVHVSCTQSVHVSAQKEMNFHRWSNKSHPYGSAVSGCFIGSRFGGMSIFSLPAGDKTVNPRLFFCMFSLLCGFISCSHSTGLSELQDVPSFNNSIHAYFCLFI